jgi:hypothetical protein
MLNWGYWSSDTLFNTTFNSEEYAWLVGMIHGGTVSELKSYADSGYVLAVRDGE